MEPNHAILTGELWTAGYGTRFRVTDSAVKHPRTREPVYTIEVVDEGHFVRPLRLYVSQDQLLQLRAAIHVALTPEPTLAELSAAVRAEEVQA